MGPTIGLVRLGGRGRPLAAVQPCGESGGLRETKQEGNILYTFYIHTYTTR